MTCVMFLIMYGLAFFFFGTTLFWTTLFCTLFLDSIVSHMASDTDTNLEIEMNNE